MKLLDGLRGRSKSMAMMTISSEAGVNEMIKGMAVIRS